MAAAAYNSASAAPISTDNATLERMSGLIRILVRIFLTRILARGLTSGERMSTIIDFVICNTDFVGPEPICPFIRRRFLAGGVHASTVVRLRDAPCRVSCCFSRTADRTVHWSRRSESPGIIKQMGALVFRCPTTHEAFRSNFRATSEELKRISSTATMELRCEICKGRHLFVVTECTIDDQA